MSPSTSLVLIALLISASGFFSMAEMSVAAARRVRLQQLMDQGVARAGLVMAVQDTPGAYFTVVQIGQNVVAILAGVVGEGAFAPAFNEWLAWVLPASQARTAATVLSFLTVTTLFILLSDVLPKRIGLSEPEKVALRVVGPMRLCTAALKPVVWFFTRLADAISTLFGLPAVRDQRITPDDILAMAEAGAQAGVLGQTEQQVIANVFELDTRTVPSAMTARDAIVHFMLDDPDTLIRARIAAEPHSTYLVCDGGIDQVVGYVDAKDLLIRLIANQPIDLKTAGLLRKVLIIPDRLTLAETLTQFRQAREDFAVIINEYSLVMGIVTINDVMSTVMGDLVAPLAEEQIVQRDANSWLIDGVTPIQDVMHALGLSDLPHRDDYETLAGFLMVMLRRVPKRTDAVVWEGLRFEVMDVDSFRIDQVMVTRLSTPAAADSQAAP